MAKQFMNEHSVAFEEVDVTSDQKAQEAMIAKSGQLAVPVIVVTGDTGEDVMVGFDRSRLAKAVGITA